MDKLIEIFIKHRGYRDDNNIHSHDFVYLRTDRIIHRYATCIKRLYRCVRCYEICCLVKTFFKPGYDDHIYDHERKLWYLLGKIYHHCDDLIMERALK